MYDLLLASVQLLRDIPKRRFHSIFTMLDIWILPSLCLGAWPADPSLDSSAGPPSPARMAAVCRHCSQAPARLGGGRGGPADGGRVVLHARHFPIDRGAAFAPAARPSALPAKGESGKHASPGRPAAASRLLVVGRVLVGALDGVAQARGDERACALAAAGQEGELVLLVGRLDPPRARAAAPPPRRARAGQSDGQSAAHARAPRARKSSLPRTLSPHPLYGAIQRVHRSYTTQTVMRATTRRCYNDESYMRVTSYESLETLAVQGKEGAATPSHACASLVYHANCDESYKLSMRVTTMRVTGELQVTSH